MNGEPGRAIIMGKNGENGAKGSKGERGNDKFENFHGNQSRFLPDKSFTNLITNFKGSISSPPPPTKRCFSKNH